MRPADDAVVREPAAARNQRHRRRRVDDRESTPNAQQRLGFLRADHVRRRRLPCALTFTLNGNGATGGTLESVTTGATSEQSCPFETVMLTFISGYVSETPPDALMVTLSLTFSGTEAPDNVEGVSGGGTQTFTCR
jgi:hypothetical protein